MLSNINSDSDIQEFINDLTVAVSTDDQKADLSLALPSLHSLVKDYSPELGDGHFNFLGESAFYFAVNCLLVEKLRHYDDQLIRLTSRQFRNIQSFAIPLFTKTKLEKYVRTGEIKCAFLSIIGILYQYLGMKTVMQFIESGVTEVLKPKKIVDSPVYNLNLRCASKGGRIKIDYFQEKPYVWKASLICKLTNDSVTFSAEATCASKLKARTTCCQMVLDYLKENPAEEEKLEAYNSTTTVYPLPVVQPAALGTNMNEDAQSIQSNDNNINHSSTSSSSAGSINNDDSDMQTNIPIPTHQQQQQQKIKQEDAFMHIKFEDDEDTIARLSNLLLGSEERAGNKRQRVHEIKYKNRETVEPKIKIESNGGITPGPTYVTHNPQGESGMVDMDMIENVPPAPQPNGEKSPIPTGQFSFFTAPETGTTVKGLFQKIFKDERVKMRGLKKSYDAKGAILSYLPSKPQNVTVKVEIKGAGGAQDPHFVADLEIRSANPVIAMYTKGAAKKKREAEAQAYCRLVELLLDPSPV